MIHIGFDARMAGVAQGGLGRYAEQVIRSFGELQGEFRVTFWLRHENWDLFDNFDERFVRVIADVPWYGIREQVALPGMFKGERCDIYHIPHFNVPVMAPQPFVFTLHDLIMWEEGGDRDTTHNRFVSSVKLWSMKRVVRRALKRSAACIVPSQWTASRIHPVTGVTPNKVEVIHEGADSLRYSGNRGDLPNPSFVRRGYDGGLLPYILTVGNAYKHKNITVVIDAIAILKDKFPKFCHVHAGPEHPKVFYESLKRYGKMKLGERFHHLGNVSDEVLATLYRNAEMFVAASSMEGFALPALEAMRCGTPVIAARASCFPEVLGEAAQYVEADDVQELARAIAALLIDVTLHKHYVHVGKVHAEQYTWSEHARRVMEIYQSVVNSKVKSQKSKLWSPPTRRGDDIP